MLKTTYFMTCVVLQSFMDTSNGVIYTYEDVELRRIFPKEFPQDTVRRTGAVDAEHLGRYNELKRYFKLPKSQLSSHFEELECYEEGPKKATTNKIVKGLKQRVVATTASKDYDFPIASDSWRTRHQLCRIDLDRYSPDEDAYYLSPLEESYVDRRRIYCLLLLCFTEDELDRVVASF